MVCPKCGGDTTVFSTRHDDNGVYRRRRCLNPACDFRFFTKETASDGAEWRRIQAERVNRERKSTIFKPIQRKDFAL